MATKKELKELASTYIENKRLADHYKKLAEAANEALKAQLKNRKDKQVDCEGDIVKYSVQKKTKVDEEMLLQALKANCPKTQAIVLKEVVDTDILESEIYHGKLTKKALKALNACQTVKEVPILTIVKGKGEK